MRAGVTRARRHPRAERRRIRCHAMHRTTRLRRSAHGDARVRRHRAVPGGEISASEHSPSRPRETEPLLMDPTRDTAWAGALGATRTLPRTPTVGIAVVRADMTKAILQLSVVERCCECTGAATSDSGRLFGDVALSTKVSVCGLRVRGCDGMHFSIDIAFLAHDNETEIKLDINSYMPLSTFSPKSELSILSTR